jgi:hypothetical protein
MRVKKEDYDALKAAIDACLLSVGESELVEHYESGRFLNSDKVHDLQKRFCWDVVYRAALGRVCIGIYEYANDDHIYTALKRICPKVTRRY